MAKAGTATELGTERIGKLLMQYAIPAIIAMTASSLYNMVDSIFIGHGVGPLAISGLAITFPLMNLAAAFGSLVGVGASTLVSVRLGQKDYDTAQHILGNVITLNRHRLHHPHTPLPRPYSLFLRSQCRHYFIRPRLHVHHPFR